jgi:lipoprotein-anchoring transpeptidase ErfK/SrfK
MRHPTRRAAMGLAVAGSAGLSGCASLPDLPIFGTLTGGWSRQGEGAVETPDYAVVYAAIPGEKHKVAAFDYTNLDPLYLRADIPYAGMEAVGTVVVDPRRRLLYHVFAQGRARRYGMAVGPEARGFSGLATVTSKRIWPDFAPAPAVAARASVGWAQLGTPAVASPARPGAPGGSRSPRGARGLYLAANGVETGYVIHGTPDPMSVGTEAKTGCIALINQDVIDLYDRAPEGTRVVVLG